VGGSRIQDALTLTIINNCLENSIVSHIQSSKTANQAWTTLINIFESQDIVTRMHMKDKLLNLKMKENSSAVKHIHNFKAHLEQLLTTGSTLEDSEAVIILMRTESSSRLSIFYSFLVKASWNYVTNINFRFNSRRNFYQRY